MFSVQSDVILIWFKNSVCSFSYGSRIVFVYSHIVVYVLKWFVHSDLVLKCVF